MANRAIVASIGAARLLTSRFYVCSLHMHSPASHDYGKASDLAESPSLLLQGENELSPKDWLAEVGKGGVEVLAITDHNVCTWACEAAHCSAGPVMVLPGCEISVKHAVPLADQVVHLLALFDQGTDSERINQIFSWAKCKSAESERDEGYVLNADLAEVVSNIRNLGGICVAAHVGSDRGLRTASQMLSFELLSLKHELRELNREPNPTAEQSERRRALDAAIRETRYDSQNRYLEFLIRAGVSAVQISKPEDEEHYRLIHTVQADGDRPIACILATDGHRLCDVCMPKHVTYIKMATPSVRGLQKAFSDPATRIRFSTTLPEIPYPRIRGIVLSGANSFFARGTSVDQVAVGFADNLTCIIGGRGSGKSCIVEGIRFALSRASIGAGGKHADEVYSKYLGHLFEDTTLSLAYDCREESTLVVKRTFGVAGAPNVQDLDGAPRHISTADNTDVRVDIYGQSELEEVARDKTAQRRLIDAIVSDSSRLLAEIRHVNDEFSANTDLCVQKAKAIQRLNAQLQGLQDVKQQLGILKDPVLQPLIDKNEIARQVDAFRLAADDSTDRASASLTDIRRDLSERQQKCAELLASDAICNDGMFAADVKPALEEANGKLLGLLGSISSLIDEAEELRQSLDSLGQSVQQAKDGIVKQMTATVSDEDGERLSGIVEKRQQLEARYADLQSPEVERDQLLDDLKDLLGKQRQALCAKRDDRTRALFEARIWAVQNIVRELELLPGHGPQVAVSLRYQADRSLFRKHIGESAADQGYLKGGEIPNHKFEGKWAKHISEQLSGWEFADLILQRNKAALVDLKRADGTPLLSDANADKLIEARAPFSATDPYDVDPEKLHKLLELADSGLAEDMPEITLAGRLIEELSPGQRCSALLPIILLSGDWPLVVDQPEDNLDNMHVFECLVEILRVLKHRRQIICATHNSNIVVSGDAEQVVVCWGEDKDSGRIIRQASIDDEDVVDPSGDKHVGIVTYVKDIMEGGEQAFRTRARKYGLALTADQHGS